MYLQLTTDFIRAKKQLKFRDGKYKCSDKRIWKLLWRGFSVDDVYKIVQEQFMYWDIPEYWEEKKLGISGRHFPLVLLYTHMEKVVTDIKTITILVHLKLFMVISVKELARQFPSN